MRNGGNFCMSKIDFFVSVVQLSGRAVGIERVHSDETGWRFGRSGKAFRLKQGASVLHKEALEKNSTCFQGRFSA